MLNRHLCFVLMVAFALSGCQEEESLGALVLEQVLVGMEELSFSGNENDGMPIDRSITLVFSRPLNQASASGAISLAAANQPVNIDISFSNQGNSVIIFPAG